MRWPAPSPVRSFPSSGAKRTNRPSPFRRPTIWKVVWSSPTDHTRLVQALSPCFLLGGSGKESFGVIGVFGGERRAPSESPRGPCVGRPTGINCPFRRGWGETDDQG